MSINITSHHDFINFVHYASLYFQATLGHLQPHTAQMNLNLVWKIFIFFNIYRLIFLHAVTVSQLALARYLEVVATKEFLNSVLTDTGLLY